MRNLILSVLLVLTLLTVAANAQQGSFFNPITGEFDGCIWFEDESGNTTNSFCGKMIVSDGALTDNGDGTFDLAVVPMGAGACADTGMSMYTSTSNTNLGYLCMNGTEVASFEVSAEATFLITEGGDFFITESGNFLIAE
jgi:Tfp pilus assembly protein PilX